LARTMSSQSGRAAAPLRPAYALADHSQLPPYVIAGAQTATLETDIQRGAQTRTTTPETAIQRGAQIASARSATRDAAVRAARAAQALDTMSAPQTADPTSAAVHVSQASVTASTNAHYSMPEEANHFTYSAAPVPQQLLAPPGPSAGGHNVPTLSSAQVSWHRHEALANNPFALSSLAPPAQPLAAYSSAPQTLQSAVAPGPPGVGAGVSRMLENGMFKRLPPLFPTGAAQVTWSQRLASTGGDMSRVQT
jgi:hypothetical protein